MTTAEILRAAKALIQPDAWLGHSTGRQHRESPPHCPLTAISRMALTSRANQQALRLFKWAVFGKGKRGYIDVWNDCRERHIEDVWAAFDRAIALAEAEA